MSIYYHFSSSFRKLTRNKWICQETSDFFLVIIFKCDLFLIMNKVDFASYADDNTPYVIGNSVKEAINSFKEA